MELTPARWTDAQGKLPSKTKRPRLTESWDARRTALPRSLSKNMLSGSRRGGNGPYGLLRQQD